MSRATRQFALATLLCACASACASIEFTRETQTSGRFVSKGVAFTIAAIDIPRPAILIARDNAVDARLTNMQVTSSSVTPDLGWWDWLADIIGIRWARIEGTWGFSGAQAGDPPPRAPSSTQAPAPQTPAQNVDG
jgi:hypothetical protein